jgi:hypothetical protein
MCRYSHLSGLNIYEIAFYYEDLKKRDALIYVDKTSKLSIITYFRQRKTKHSNICPYNPVNLCSLFEFQTTQGYFGEKQVRILIINAPPKTLSHYTF